MGSFVTIERAQNEEEQQSTKGDNEISCACVPWTFATQSTHKPACSNKNIPICSLIPLHQKLPIANIVST